MSQGNPGGVMDPGPLRTLAPSPTRLMASTPQAIPTSMAPAPMRLATKWFACWAEPHWQSTVVAAVAYGRPWLSHAVRVTLEACSPAWVTHPPTTCSTSPGSIPARLTSSTWALPSNSAEWKPAIQPLRFPIGVRTASMITGWAMVVPSLRCRSDGLSLNRKGSKPGQLVNRRPLHVQFDPHDVIGGAVEFPRIERSRIHLSEADRIGHL